MSLPDDLHVIILEQSPSVYTFASRFSAIQQTYGTSRVWAYVKGNMASAKAHLYLMDWQLVIGFKRTRFGVPMIGSSELGAKVQLYNPANDTSKEEYVRFSLGPADILIGLR